MNTTTGRSVDANSSARVTTSAYAVANLHIGLHQLMNGRMSLYFDIYNLADRLTAVKGIKHANLAISGF